MRISDWSSDVCSSDLSKLWVALTVLDAIDRGELSFDQKVRIGPEDLTLFHQPLAARVRSEGSVTMTVRDLIETAITHSDNSANDSLLRTVGGPEAVRRFLAKHDLGKIRSEEHTSELPSLMRISYADFCLQKKIHRYNTQS